MRKRVCFFALFIGGRYATGTRPRLLAPQSNLVLSEAFHTTSLWDFFSSFFYLPRISARAALAHVGDATTSIITLYKERGCIVLRGRGRIPRTIGPLCRAMGQETDELSRRGVLSTPESAQAKRPRTESASKYSGQFRAAFTGRWNGSRSRRWSSEVQGRTPRCPPVVVPRERWPGGPARGATCSARRRGAEISNRA